MHGTEFAGRLNDEAGGTFNGRAARDVHMKLHDVYLSEELYTDFLTHMPETCVELVLQHRGTVLLAKREIEPAKGEWFWPGSRLYKGEPTEEAAHRVAREELGIEIELESLLGVYSHFWDRSAQSPEVSRHTVNVVYRARPVEDDPRISLDDQHGEFRWLDDIEPELHEYVRTYIEDGNLLEP